MNKFYITTPLYYVNSKPHIGHSYTQVACDVAARFMRLSGRDVLFMTGTDEHGEKIEKAAMERGFAEGREKEFVDEIVPVFKGLWADLDIRYDHFIRTTDDYHVKAVQAVLEILYKAGKIYKKAYKGWFCTPCETFWSEAQSPDGACPDCKRPVERLDEANYFLRISEYQRWLIEHIKSDPGFIQPGFRKNEVLGFLAEPLLDLCISRPKGRLSWGIEIPFNRDYVTYVWFDALLNYISGAGYPHDMARFKRYWPADFHIIGKDILRHHAVYWPIILKALDLPPPKTVFAHGWWVMKGEKMSKSKGNVVDPAEIVASYGVDPYRYFLMREVQFGMDGAFSEEALVTRYNSDLANDLGNLLNRTLTMVEKYFDGKAPPVKSPSQCGAKRNLPEGDQVTKTAEKELKDKALEISVEMERSIPRFDFLNALTKIWEVINIANKYIEDSRPWTLAKEGRREELSAVIYTLVEVLRISAAAVYPFIPGTAKNIWSQLGMKDEMEDMKISAMKTWGAVEPGQKINKSSPLFPRIEK